MSAQFAKSVFSQLFRDAYPGVNGESARGHAHLGSPRNPGRGRGGSSRLGSPGLSLQRTLEVSEQIQKPRALFLPLQLEVLQVIWLLLTVKVALLLPLLLPLALQEPQPITLLEKPLPFSLPLPLQVVLPREETPVEVQEPHPAFLGWSGF